MYFLWIYLAIIALALGCPPPFNNADFIREDDMAAAVKGFLLNNLDGNLGWTDAVTHRGTPRTSWPESAQGTVIKYCYWGPQDEIDFKAVLEAGWKVWADAIGPPGASSGHRLRFEEARPGQYCQVGRSMRDPTLVWDRDLPGDTLVIHSHDQRSYGALATLGYIYELNGPQPGRHIIAIRRDITDANNRDHVTILAHEIGHVLGLAHEHQRVDRDHYVLFQCEKLAGYEEAKKEVLAGKIWTVEQLCHDSNIGHAFGFPSADYSKRPKVDEQGETLYLNNGADYDPESIMHYGSLAGSNFRNINELLLQGGGLAELPLIVWKDRSATFVPPGPPYVGGIPFSAVVGNKPPSAKDIERVLQLYPWRVPVAPRPTPTPTPVTPTGTQHRAPTNWS